jgi:hypothetical protein
VHVGAAHREHTEVVEGRDQVILSDMSAGRARQVRLTQPAGKLRVCNEFHDALINSRE